MISPCLFKLCMGCIVREAKERSSGGVKLEERNVQFLIIADDLLYNAGG